MLQDKAQQIIDRCQAALKLAQELYGVDTSKVGIRFDLKGAAAGMACARSGPGGRTYYMRFNRDMLTREAFDHVLNNTVPHEVAHLVCYMRPELGRNHNSGWESICVRLGGSGETRHSEEVVYGKGKTYEYTTTNGHQVRLSEQRHNKVQRGTTLTYRDNKGQVNRHCAHAVVGYQGRTLAAPVQAKPANHPALIEQALRMPPKPAIVRPFAPLVITPRAHVPTKAPVTTNLAGQPKSVIARVLIKRGYDLKLTSDVVIDQIIAETGMARAMAKNYFKVGCKQLGLPENYGI